MGVATGVLQTGASPANCAVLEQAMVVSDAGAGGQVLLCRGTFHAIKDATDELGSVTEEGTAAAGASKPFWRWFRCGAACMACRM